MAETGNERLADLFEDLRGRRTSPNAQYNTDDVIAVLLLLSRGYNVSEIERRTYITRPRITRWRDLFMDGRLEDLYPDLRERMMLFNTDALPPPRVNRIRQTFAWAQPQARLEDRPNPYIVNGNGRSPPNGNGNGKSAKT